jgi:hypothetical protein
MKIPAIPLAAAGLALTLSMTASSLAQYHPYAPYLRSEAESARSVPQYDTSFLDESDPPPAPGNGGAPPAPIEMTPAPADTGWTTPAPVGGACPQPCQHFCEPCQCECFCGGWFGGFEFAWLRPRFSDNTSIIVDPLPDDNFAQPFDYEFETSPRIWLGHVNENGFGLQVRYFQFDGEADDRSFSPDANNPVAFIEVYGAGGNISRNAFAGVGETLTVTHDVELHVFDLEAVQRWEWNRMLLMGSFGARYVRMDQDMLATAITAAGVLDEMVDHDHSFEGFGPVVGLQLTRSFGGSGLGVYGNVRGSILFGDQDQTIVEIKNAGANVGTDVHNGDEVMAIGEISFGLQYARELRRGAQGFVRVGYESQIWWDAGSAIDTTSNMGLEGFTLGFGVYR